MSIRKRVLITDDSPTLRELIQLYLSEAFPDCTFLEAGDGEEAERLVQEAAIFDEPIHVLFLDWMMPKMTGFELLQKLRSTPQFQHSPKIVMLTAETYAEQEAACREYGVSDYVTKPFTQEQIVSVLKPLLD